MQKYLESIKAIDPRPEETIPDDTTESKEVSEVQTSAHLEDLEPIRFQLRVNS